jgi:hypothetical protein
MIYFQLNMEKIAELTDAIIFLIDLIRGIGEIPTRLPQIDYSDRNLPPVQGTTFANTFSFSSPFKKGGIYEPRKKEWSAVITILQNLPLLVYTPDYPVFNLPASFSRDGHIKVLNYKIANNIYTLSFTFWMTVKDRVETGMLAKDQRQVYFEQGNDIEALGHIGRSLVIAITGLVSRDRASSKGNQRYRAL